MELNKLFLENVQKPVNPEKSWKSCQLFLVLRRTSLLT